MATTKTAKDAKQTSETPRQRFERVGGKRVANALDKIDLVGQVSDPRRYGYTVEDIEKAFDAMQERLTHAKNKMLEGLQKQTGKGEKTPFNF